MSKYIIEIAEEYEEYFKGVLICGIADEKFAVDIIAREDLEELNSDYINENFGELQDEAYQRGLDEAMNAFKKLYSCGGERDWKAMGFEFDEGEWSSSFEYIIDNYTASEIVEKVKAYKDKKIHVGDFVSHNDVPEIIVLVTYVGCNTFNGVAMTDVEDHCRKGESYTYCASEDWHKVNAQLVKGVET